MYGVKVGDRVQHVKDIGIMGTVLHIDDNLIGVTTCEILWDDSIDGATDIQWTNKLVVVSEVSDE